MLDLTGPASYLSSATQLTASPDGVSCLALFARSYYYTYCGSQGRTYFVLRAALETMASEMECM